ncbi:MAG: hypothetical protein ACLFPL_01935 [Candidatus Nanoarchaeia archaeon]
MITTILLLLLGVILCVEAIALLLYPKKIKKLVNLLFKHQVYLHVIAAIELIIGLVLIVSVLL